MALPMTSRYQVSKMSYFLNTSEQMVSLPNIEKGKYNLVINNQTFVISPFLAYTVFLMSIIQIFKSLAYQYITKITVNT